jgi:hypothetical protein
MGVKVARDVPVGTELPPYASFVTGGDTAEVGDREHSRACGDRDVPVRRCPYRCACEAGELTFNVPCPAEPSRKVFSMEGGSRPPPGRFGVPASRAPIPPGIPDEECPQGDLHRWMAHQSCSQP